MFPCLLALVLIPTRLLAVETLRATMFPQQCFLVCGGLKTGNSELKLQIENRSEGKYFNIASKLLRVDLFLLRSDMYQRKGSVDREFW